MSARIVISCDQAWDGGRMPCRAQLPTDTVHADLAYEDAEKAGWTQDVGNVDACPSHSRIAAEAGAA